MNRHPDQRENDRMPVPTQPLEQVRFLLRAPDGTLSPPAEPASDASV